MDTAEHAFTREVPKRAKVHFKAYCVSVTSSSEEFLKEFIY